MELSSFTLNMTWIMCILAILFCCLNVDISTAKYTTLEFDIPVVAETPISGIFTEHPKQSLFTSDIHDKQLIMSTRNMLGIQENKMVEKKCNIFDGKWVYKSEAQWGYDANSCPFIEDAFSCRKNGRPDLGYEKWRWEANDCKIPLFNGKDMLERLKNKRVIIVGDSLNKNMWESLACLLYSSVPSNRVEFNATSSRYKMLKAKDYNTTIEFHWSPLLVELDTSHESGKTVLVLDKLSDNSELWRGADVMVFNSAHWWVHTGKMKKWELLQYKGQLFEDMPLRLAYKRGMKTWEDWINKNVDPKKTTVLFKSAEPEHNGRKGCYNASHPIMDESFKNKFPKSLINAIEDVIKGMSNIKVKYLNITKLSEYRIDSHPSVYTNNWRWKIYITKYKRLIPTFADCSHWCLPGLPDTWNQLLYSIYFSFL